MHFEQTHMNIQSNPIESSNMEHYTFFRNNGGKNDETANLLAVMWGASMLMYVVR